ncbi:MAG: hypothetical protein ACI92G_001904 [Candidatus Pelagisphaera sp.]|jgi:hypothetical protein
MHPLADYIPSILFVAAAIAIPTELDFEAEENEQSIEIADNERDLSETVVGEPLAVEELIDEKELVSPVAGIVASSY